MQATCIRRRRALPAVIALIALVLTTALAGSAFATHARPGSGTPYRVSLLPAMRQCAAPNSTHAATLTFGSCNPPVEVSGELTMGKLGAGAAFVKMTVTTTPDITVTAKATDVRCFTAFPNCPGPNTDYTGDLLLTGVMRLTDHANGPAPVIPPPCANPNGTPPCVTATVDDFPQEWPVPCVATTNPNGANCGLTTSINAAFPGRVLANQRGSYQLVDHPELMDPGPDGVVNPGSGCPPFCHTGDEGPYLVHGLFVP